jgi:uridylate kinase
MGLLSTVINGIALKDVLVHRCGMKAELFSDVASADVAERFLVRKIADYWKTSDILVFTGTGAPAVGRSTDSVAADIAVQLGASLLLKATKFDGVHDRDPARHSDAQRIPAMSYEQFLALPPGELMDVEAVLRCKKYDLMVRIFGLPPEEPGRIWDACRLDCSYGTLISQKEP